MRREFRGLWIATVGNIDWPSRPGLSAEQQRAELLSILARAVAAGLNAIVFHVRPAADAVYRSAFEPWGAMLTGTQGTDPGYDPLTFAVVEAHRRGLELHAWVNPFRAGNSADTAGRLAVNHVFRERRDLVRVYGTQLWLDPGVPEVHDRSMRAILDIVNRYDVDAVHLDDFFYPYPQTDSVGRPRQFPDSVTYARYGAGTSLDDWRRANVDRFVERLYREVHAAKPMTRVGISPFGIWRPGNPSQVSGLDAYAAIYADSRKWLQSGWVDYLAPQLYWRIDPPQQSFTALLDWWLAQNTRARHVWPGLATYRVYETTAPWPVSEIESQVRATQERGSGGMLFYNTTSTLSRNGGEVASALKRELFVDIALPPVSPWLDAQRAAAPLMTVTNPAPGSWSVSLAAQPVRWWLVRFRAADRWTTRLSFGDQSSLTLTTSNGAAVDWVVVNAVDRAGNTSDDATWRGIVP
ncbi:MAG: family 10 glycosylhydrolase [Gemmatimonadota bacterium]|nr:family 10 glycosylhydrolase [Gemmatimonadota bacterium]